MATLDFDSEGVPDPEGRDVLPAGEYRAFIKESELKDTKAGDGKYLELMFEIIEGEKGAEGVKGRKVFTNITTVNKSDTAVRIGRETLAMICRAAKMTKILDSQELHNIVMIIALKVVNRKDTGEPKNEIKNDGYRVND